MLSDTDVANQALENLGAVSSIQNIVTDQTKEARSARTYIGSVRRRALERYNWNFATAYEPLVLVECFPHAQWKFIYQKPPEALRLSRIYNGSHKDDNETKIEITQGQFKGQPVIFSNVPLCHYMKVVNGVSTPETIGPILQYVEDFKDVVHMPEAFKGAWAMELSAFMAPSIPGIGQKDLRKENLVLAAGMWQEALANDLNQSWIRPELKSFIQRAAQGERNGRFSHREHYQDANYNFGTG